MEYKHRSAICVCFAAPCLSCRWKRLSERISFSSLRPVLIFRVINLGEALKLPASLNFNLANNYFPRVNERQAFDISGHFYN